MNDLLSNRKNSTCLDSGPLVYTHACFRMRVYFKKLGEIFNQIKFTWFLHKILLKNYTSGVFLTPTLLENGFWCSPVVAPACSVRFPRFRITVTVSYTKTIIDNFVNTLIKLCEENPVG